jgi:hypothetical protein
VTRRPLLRGALTALITAALVWFLFFTGSPRYGYLGGRVLRWTGDWVDWTSLLIIVGCSIAVAIVAWRITGLLDEQP